VSLEFIDELENKVNGLIGTITREREEKNAIQNELNDKNGKIHSLEEENSNLKKELDELKSSGSDFQQKMDEASDKIRNIINKLESVG